MTTRIRLKRTGRRNRPSFRVVVMDSRTKRDGASIEQLGWYDPIKTENNFSLKEDRILHWLKLGAQPTATVKNLMKKSGLLYRWFMMRQDVDETTIDHELQKWAFDREAREKEKADKRIQKVDEKSKAKAKTEAKAAVTEIAAVEETEKIDRDVGAEEVEFSEETETVEVSKEAAIETDESEEVTVEETSKPGTENQTEPVKTTDETVKKKTRISKKATEESSGDRKSDVSGEAQKGDGERKAESESKTDTSAMNDADHAEEAAEDGNSNGKKKSD